MESMQDVVIDCKYFDLQGAEFSVISKGTGGVVVEYHDGRVELISPDNWQKLGAAPQTRQ